MEIEFYGFRGKKGLQNGNLIYIFRPIGGIISINCDTIMLHKTYTKHTFTKIKLLLYVRHHRYKGPGNPNKITNCSQDISFINKFKYQIQGI